MLCVVDQWPVLICELPWWRAACVVPYHRWTYGQSASCGPSWMCDREREEKREEEERSVWCRSVEVGASELNNEPRSCRTLYSAVVGFSVALACCGKWWSYILPAASVVVLLLLCCCRAAALSCLALFGVFDFLAGTWTWYVATNHSRGEYISTCPVLIQSLSPSVRCHSHSPSDSVSHTNARPSVSTRCLYSHSEFST